MATAHQLSTYINSCVKPPSNPKSGLSFTLDERTSANRSGTWHGRDADFLSGPADLTDFQASRSFNFDSTNTMMETVIPDLNDLSDAEFYQRLVDLRTEHKKTLEMCEDLYNEKLRETGRALTPERRHHSPIPVASVDADYTMSTQPKEPPISFTTEGKIPQNANGHSRDKLRDMSFSKPPTGRPKESKGTPARPGATKTRHAQTSMNGSYDEKFWQTVSTSSTEVDFKSSPERSKQRNEDHERVASRIDEMWKDFSIDDYAPRSTRQRSNSFSGPSNKEAQDEWRHRVTIPKPFRMTVREESKPKRKSQNIEEYERKRGEELRSEQEECEKKFKARPVPAHVYMPLYDEIMEEKETKRRYARETSKEALIAQQKPFKFHTREEEKKKIKRMQSAPVSNIDNEFDIRASQTFKANPFPEHIFSDTVTDRMEEDEEYRRIRKQMRSEELLKTSSLPANMKARGQDYVDGKSRMKKQSERAKRAGITVHHKFKPRINNEIPDFEELHRKFHSKLAVSKYGREATVCKPFNLRTERIPSRKHQIYEDIARDEESLRENRWPFSGSRSRPFTKSAEWAFGTSLSSSMDSLPTKMTTAANLRQSSSRNKMQRQIDRELAELERERRRRLKEKELKKVISRKASANDQTSDLRKSTEEKLREHRTAERERMIEYRKELKQMYENVKSRPLLFEQTIQRNAEQRAQRKYNETLRNAGLDEEFVTTKGRLAENGDDLGLSDDEDSYRIPYDDSRHSSVHSAYSDTHSASRNYTDDFDASDADGDRAGGDDSIHEEIEDLE